MDPKTDSKLGGTKTAASKLQNLVVATMSPTTSQRQEENGQRPGSRRGQLKTQQQTKRGTGNRRAFHMSESTHTHKPKWDELHNGKSDFFFIKIESNSHPKYMGHRPSFLI
jgi:hypothetical protein